MSHPPNQNQAASPQELSASTLAALPAPDRLYALETSGLVRTWAPGDKVDGLWIFNGRIRPPNDAGVWSTPPLPEHLLDTGEVELAAEAKKVLLLRNRIVLEGDMRLSLAFLQGLGPEERKAVRRLDLRFDEIQVEAWAEEETEKKKAAEGRREAWRALATFLGEDMAVEEMDLALDAGGCYETYREQVVEVEESEIPYVRAGYEGIANALVEGLKGRRPSRFAVYWAAFHALEGEVERRVMGDAYDSGSWGKIESRERNPSYPHGAPASRLEWEGMGLR